MIESGGDEFSRLAARWERRGLSPLVAACLAAGDVAQRYRRARHGRGRYEAMQDRYSAETGRDRSPVEAVFARRLDYWRRCDDAGSLVVATIMAHEDATNRSFTEASHHP